MIGAKEIDIAATLEHLRDQRPGMVQTKVRKNGLHNSGLALTWFPQSRWSSGLPPLGPSTQVFTHMNSSYIDSEVNLLQIQTQKVFSQTPDLLRTGFQQRNLENNLFKLIFVPFSSSITGSV